MKIPYFCCIGAELKRYAQDFDFMNQVYLYKVPTDDTIEEVLAQDYFQPVADTVLQDDIVYIYEPTTETLYTCHFNKQNGHITAEQMANNIPSLTPDKILISDATGHITAGDVSLDYIKNQLLAKVNIDGSSTMTGPLKFRAGSFSGAIAGGLGDGISIYKIKTDGTIDSEVASLTKTNGFVPGTNNAMDIGRNNYKWKDAYIARVITAVLNNGADIGVPTTGGTMALTSDIKNSTVSVQLDGSAVDSFTLNQSSNKTINIPAANKDLSNLTSTGQNISNWSSNVSNCITYIPQDIKLELNNGTLTLKAGSKVYVPNGAGVFNQITIANDKVLTQNWNNTDSVFIAWYDNNLTLRKITDVCSGATDTISGRFHWWYDTTNNIIKEIESDGTARTNKLCFPLAVLTMVGDGTAHVSSINLIFGGFGYIGNSVFALPGLSGLVPNGRNADGTLKNTAWTTTQVIVRTFTNGGNYSLFFDGNVFARTSGYEYKEQENLNWDTIGNQIFTVTYLCLIRIDGTGRITYMGNRNVFHSVDYDDSDWVAHQAMPSNRYVDLTLPSVNTYTSITVPADGYVSLSMTTTGVQYAMLTNSTTSVAASYVSVNSGDSCRIFVPVSKGDTVGLMHNLAGTLSWYRFIYANGVK